MGSYLEHVLIATVVTILATRGYLQATGFPQIGGGGLHIAHMLWGGLLMLVGNVLLLAFLGRHIRRMASFVAGIGFGLFIDELGKFITSNNDYFYQPTIGIIYLILIALFLIFRFVERRAPLSPVELLANAAETLVDASIGRARQREIRAGLRDLDTLDGPSAGNAGRWSMRELLEDAATARAERREHGRGVRARARRLSTRVLRWRWLQRAVLAIFVLEAVASLVLAGVLLALPGPGALAGQVERSFAVIGHLATSALEFVLVLVGVALLPRARLRGYRTLRLSLLVSVFLSQGFLFFEQQFGALGGLAVNLLMLVVLDTMIASTAANSPNLGDDVPRAD